MSSLSIALGIAPFSPTFREIGRTEFIDGKPKVETSHAISKRKKNKGKPNGTQKAQHESKKLRADILKVMESGCKYNAKTMGEKLVGRSLTAIRWHFKELVKSGIAECETIDCGRYDVTWYWIR